MTRTALAVIAVMAAVAPARKPVALLASTAFAAPSTPVIEGPVTGGHGTPLLIATTLFDLSEIGYEQVEWFIGGTATAYTSAAPLSADGRWTVTPGATAPYKTRLLVYRPSDPSRFDGTVVVEWFNVSGGLEAAPDWIAAHTEMVRAGMVWVGVSAQYRGVEGGGSGGLLEIALKTGDPARYGSLVHPGDSFSYDIYSQAGMAIRSPSGPLADLPVRRVIADGESQSASRMVSYIDAVHPLAHAYDGFLVHSRGKSAEDLSQDPQPTMGAPDPTFIRSDVDVPVLLFETESDLTLLGYFPDRQKDTKRIRLWEVAGTAHEDTYTLLTGMHDHGDDPSVAAVVVTASPIPGIIDCAVPINSGPQHVVLDAAVATLERWVRTGKPPRKAPRLRIDPGPPVAIRRDPAGNARGGIRTPWVDAPVATLSGDGHQTGTDFCDLFGTTVPFDAATLAARYRSHAAFVKAYTRSTRRAVRAGFLLQPDAALMLEYAATAAIGG